MQVSLIITKSTSDHGYDNILADFINDLFLTALQTGNHSLAFLMLKISGGYH